MKIQIPYQPVHIALFLLLAFLCYQAHQFVRHLAGAILCGGFGRMTFTVTTTMQPCFLPTVVTLSGPMLTYGLAWFGILLLRSPKYILFAYAIIFASFAPLRFVQTLSGRGDELLLAQELLGVSNQWIVAAMVLLIGIPPIVVAFRVIANRRRLLIFTGSLFLPLSILILLLVGNQFLFGTSDVSSGANLNGTPFGSFLGISLIVLITDLVAIALFAVFAPRYLRPDIVA